jgi:hypothetical protein
MAYEHGLSDEVVKEGQAILDQKDVSIGETMDAFLDFVSGHGLSQTLQLLPELLLTHPKNRGTLLLNAFNAHRNGSMIRRVGANLDELKSAVAMGMHADPKIQKDIFACYMYMYSTATHAKQA